MKKPATKTIQNGLGVAAIYARVSTEGQQQKGTSLDSQSAAGIAKAQELGYTVGEVLKEQHTGSELWERPKLSQLRDDIKAGKYQAVIIYAVDRLSREVSHLYIIVDEFERAGVELIFVTEELDKTPEGQLMFGIKGYVAKIEKGKIVERCIRGKRTKALLGRVVRGGTDLYGYGYDPVLGFRVINEVEAVTVRQMYRWAADGVSTRSIIRRLNERGIPPPSQGKRKFKHPRYSATPSWGSGAVKRILDDVTYKGDAYAFRWKSGGRRKVIARPFEEWIKLPEGAAPAIVSPELWAAAQERLKANRGDQTRNEQRPDLLRGHVFCAECGLRMCGDNEHGRFRVYRCPSRSKPTGACGSKRVPAADCETEAWKLIQDILQKPSLVTSEIKRRQAEGNNPRKELEASLERERQALRKVEGELQQLVNRAATASDDMWSVWEKSIAEKNAARKLLEAAVTEAEARLTAKNADAEQVTSLTTYAARVRSRLAVFGFDDKRLAFEALNVRIQANGRAWSLGVALPNGGRVSQSCC